MATPHPTPTAILKARGSWLAKAREGKGEPKPPKGKVVMPDWMTGHAEAAWRKYQPICERMGVLTVADQDAFVIMCAAIGESEWAYEKLSLATVNGHLAPELEVMTIDKRTKMGNYALKQASMAGRFMSWFGLTPSARAGLSVPKPEPGADGALAQFKSAAKGAEDADGRGS